MKNEKIPFNKPFIIGGELFNIARAVIEYSDLSGDGVYTHTCQEWFQKKLGCGKALLTNSCTAALEMAAILCDIKPGDEVIMPSFTFVSTANAFVLRGGVPVFVDIRPDTLNIDEKKIEAAITSRTKAIVPVHYAGVPCAMDEIMQIAERHQLWVIEDAAQALLSKYKNKFLGTIGHFGTLSFHETKNIISGEGGALLVNDTRFAERAEIIWEKGTNRKSFFRGEIDKYTWVDIGSSFLPSEMIAAFLAEQLKYAETIIGARRRVFELYNRLLKDLEEQKKIRLPRIEPGDDNNGHIFYLIARSEAERTGLLDYLKKENIHAVFHYIPLHSSPAGMKYGKMGAKQLYNTDDLGMRVVRLPLFYEMSDEQVHRVVEAIVEFYSSISPG